jgi:probable biosynthetic protein (TIGR04098 family)
MPQLDVRGLSEGWLYRHVGDLHWEAIGRQLGVTASEFRGEAGDRIYPTVVALRARARAPLAAVREDDDLEARVEVVPCGRACAHGRIAVVAGAVGISVELLTTFAVRDPGGGLRMALPAPELAARWRTAEETPAIARLAKAARRGEPADDPFAGPYVAPERELKNPLGRLEHEPSPYGDYNGAGLLYFATYPTIADTVERKLVQRLALSPRPKEDWALATSVVGRDIFYYGNLPLGETLTAELLEISFDAWIPPGLAGSGVKTRVRLRRTADGQPMADLVTRRLFMEAPLP